MESLHAFNLALTVIRIADFSVKILQKEHKIHTPSDGSLEKHRYIEDICKHVSELAFEVDQNALMRQMAEALKSRKPTVSAADEQLIRLGDDAKEVTSRLLGGLDQARTKRSSEDWPNVYRCLHSVLKKKEVKALRAQFEKLRKQVDFALLFLMRERLDRPIAESNTPHGYGEFTTTIEELTRWQGELFAAVKANDWHPTSKEDVANFAVKVSAVTQFDTQARFRSIVFDRLRFEEISDRADSIPKAQEQTMNWIYNSNGPDDDELFLKHQPWDSYADWLGSKRGDNLYWITGKPGSGKSVLMRHLFRTPRAMEILSAWSGAAPVVHAGFFFWNSGTAMQMSSLAFLRSLLYDSLQYMLNGPLKWDPKIVEWLFQDRWGAFDTYAGGKDAFTWPELRRAFDMMISDVSKRFFFMIDGLDEVDGDPLKIVELIVDASKRNNVKICTASRSWNVFEEAFSCGGSLVLEELNGDDITWYITSRLSSTEQFPLLRKEQPDRAAQTISTLAAKASGTFLWAYLAVEYLLSTLPSANSMLDIQATADAVPEELDSLFDELLHRLNATDYRRACQMLRLMDAHGYPSLVNLFFADDEAIDLKTSLQAEVRNLQPDELLKVVNEMKRRINTRCKGFLEVYEPKREFDTVGMEEQTQSVGVIGSTSTSARESTSLTSQSNAESMKVHYSHRCAREYLLSPHIQSRIQSATGDSTYSPDEHWAHAYLWALKTLQPVQTLTRTIWPIWETLAWCIEYALRLQEADSVVRMTYLDEVGRAGVSSRLDLIKENDTILPPGCTATSFLDIAVWLKLVGYTRLKMKTAKREEVKHALEYWDAVSTRLGSDMGDWVGERRCLGKSLKEELPEFRGLLLFYAKTAAARAVTPKPHVEVPRAL